MVDGSVRFVSETINVGDPSKAINSTNCGVSNTYRNFAGASLWGIWGAMGSVNGGETVSL